MTTSTIFATDSLSVALGCSRIASSRHMLDCVYVVAGKSLLILHIVFFKILCLTVFRHSANLPPALKPGYDRLARREGLQM